MMGAFLRYISKRSFNMFDGFVMITASTLIHQHEWAFVCITLVLGSLISVTLERHWGSRA